MSKKLSRRKFLKGSGSLIALPVLESLPGFAHAAPPPKRIVVLSVPNGGWSGFWRATGTGTDYSLGPQIKSVLGVRNDILYLERINQRVVYEAGGNHDAATLGYLTCTDRNGNQKDGYNGASYDQIIANKIGGATAVKSLVIKNDNEDVTISFTRHKQAAASYGNANGIFNLLNSNANPEDVELTKRLRLVDYVRMVSGNFQAKLSTADQFKLGEYMQSVDELETSIENAQQAQACAMTNGTPDGTYPTDVKNKLDLIVQALKCDVTRVITYQFGTEASPISFDFLGAPGLGHHCANHPSICGGDVGQGAARNFNGKITNWYGKQMAYLVNALRSVPEANGTLLDNTLIVFGSSMGNAHNHTNDEMLTVLAGGKNLGLRSGKHMTQYQPMNKVYTTIMKQFGVNINSFAGVSGTISGLFT